MYEFEEYEINIEEIVKDFKIKEKSLIHSQGNKFKLLPYAANEKNLVDNFNGVTGAFSRLISQVQLNKEFEIDTFVEDVLKHIGEFQGERSQQVFRDIVKNLFIDDKSLVNFDIKTLNYMSATSADEKIAKFIFSVLFDEQLKEFVGEKYKSNPDNILYKLILRSLPKLKENNKSIDNYKCYLPFIKELFIEDFKFIISNEELYKDSLKQLIEFYYLFYVIQLSLKLSKFEKADLNKADEVYFTLSWENTSKNRTAYKFGWENVKPSINSLFSHAITLELLNHSNINRQLGYKELYEIFNECNQEFISNKLDNLINQYKNCLEDVNWDKLNRSISNDTENIAFNRAVELFNTIEYQFTAKNSSRKRAYEAYKNWIVKYVQSNFGKRRGALGYNLNITEENIIFITNICIKDKEKLKLKNLFDEFEKRGLFFDRDSKIKIIQLYEKLNLIEKKSDSGDAQYVKSIL